MSKENCSCKWCRERSPLISKIKSFLNEEDKLILNDMITDLIMAETDVIYWKDKYHGTWPSDSVKDIQNHIERLNDRIKEIEIIENLESEKDYKNSLKDSKE